MREITKIMKGWEFTGPDGTPELQALEPDANGVRRAYRVEGGIPVLLVDEARIITD